MDLIIQEFKEFVQSIESYNQITKEEENNNDTDNHHDNHGRIRLITLEGMELHLLLNPGGFEITNCSSKTKINNEKDNKNDHSIREMVGKSFESMEALLSFLSPLYRERFSKKLIERLLIQ